MVLKRFLEWLRVLVLDGEAILGDAGNVSQSDIKGKSMRSLDGKPVTLYGDVSVAFNRKIDPRVPSTGSSEATLAIQSFANRKITNTHIAETLWICIETKEPLVFHFPSSW